MTIRSSTPTFCEEYTNRQARIEQLESELNDHKVRNTFYIIALLSVVAGAIMVFTGVAVPLAIALIAVGLLLAGITWACSGDVNEYNNDQKKEVTSEQNSHLAQCHTCRV